MELQTAIESLQKHGFSVQHFSTGAEAAHYLNSVIDQTELAFGGSMTLQQLGLYESLSTHNRVLWHWRPTEGKTVDEMRLAAMTTPVYLCSANALTERGELVNIDGAGNRIASTMYGHQRLYYVLSVNKLVADLTAAEERIRQVATPQNCKRLNTKTPCADGVKCYHCDGANCPLRGMVVQMRPMTGVATEVILIDETYGY